MTALGTGAVDPAGAADPGLEGFGATTPGGAGRKVVRVTTLDDAGPGSLREALAGGSRRVVFDVSGEIDLADFVSVRGAFVTLDGLSAPAPGITLKNYGLIVRGTRGAHDVIIRGVRIAGSAGDGIQIGNGAANIVVDRVSIRDSADGHVDIVDGARNVTVSWSTFLGTARQAMAIRNGAAGVSVHHNLFSGNRNGSPAVSLDLPEGADEETTADVRNNLVASWGRGRGTFVHHGARVNVVGNYYLSPESNSAARARALVVCHGDCNDDPASLAHAWTEANYMPVTPPIDFNAQGNAPGPFDAPAVTTTDACTAAAAVKARAGARPLAAADAAEVAAIKIAPCTADLAITELAVPPVGHAGEPLPVTEATANLQGVAGPSTTRLYLSRSRTARGALPIAGRAIGVLVAGETSAVATAVILPPTVRTGSYYVVAVADADRAVKERDEALNNTRAEPIAVTGLPDLEVLALTVVSSARAGASVKLTDTVHNVGSEAAPAAEVVFFLASSPDDLTGGVRLGSRAVPALAPGKRSAATTAVTLPAGLAPARYHVIAVLDPTGALVEADTANNVATRGITIR